MSYYSELKKLIAAGHDPDTSPTVAALRSLHGGDRTVNVSTVGNRIARVAMSDEDKRQLANYESRIRPTEGERELRDNFNRDSQVTQSDLL